MRLYHFTSVRWLESIMADGVIKTTASNIAGPERHEAPDKQTYLAYRTRGVSVATEPKVVWLTNNAVVDASYLGMIMRQEGDPFGTPIPAHMTPKEFRKTRVRITVEVPDADVHWWPYWARHNDRAKINERWYQQLAEGKKPKEWFVVTRQIPLDEIVQIEIDDSVVWPNIAQPKTGIVNAVKSWLHF